MNHKIDIENKEQLSTLRQQIEDQYPFDMDQDTDQYNLDISIMAATSILLNEGIPEQYSHSQYLEAELEDHIDEIANLSEQIATLYHLCDLERKGMIQFKNDDFELTDKGRAAVLSM